MKRYTGKTIAEGTALGKLMFYAGGREALRPRTVSDAERELARYQEGEAAAAAQLRELSRGTRKEAGKAAEIFEAQAMLLEDPAFRAYAGELIREGKTDAGYAAWAAGEHFAAELEKAEDDYLRQRAGDIRDAAKTLADLLRGRRASGIPGEGPVILLAEELTPGETAGLDRSRLLAFVTEQGSPVSHTAILARAMGIPALAGISLEREMEGRMAVVDGEKGQLLVDPDPRTLELYREKLRQEEQQARGLEKLRDKESVTRDGRRIALYANIGNAAEAEKALAAGAEGIGLFRSEFLFLGRKEVPSEEEQFQAYRAAAEVMQGRKVILRTLDLGADKQAECLTLEPEANPALGLRGIRLCLARRELFLTQLRAVYRASAYGNIALMYPMIISAQEVREAKALAARAREELKEQGIPFREVEQGIMIETPAAALISDLLAKEADFFSIGTNDLTQYALAVDRQNAKLDGIRDPRHPAVLRLIRMIAENGRRGGCRVGICGELAADPGLTAFFLETGIQELSVAPAAVLPLRKAIREMGPGRERKEGPGDENPAFS